MHTVVHITGTSSGLGLGLANYYSGLEGVHVHGYSRREGPSLPNYTHHQIDLSEANSELNIDIEGEFDRAILINNAGWIGPVNSIGQLASDEISTLFELNVSAVMRWSNYFVENIEAKNKVVISISSGAATNVIPSWSAYCASKAAVDMMTEVWNVDEPSTRFLSIAPGVVDTEMQAAIRAVDVSSFPQVGRFIDLHEAGELKSPDAVAQIIGKFGFRPDEAPSNVFSVRDL